MTAITLSLFWASLTLQYRIHLQGAQAAAEEAARPFVRRGH